ncbi:MAG: DUF4124 domain-containing protein [Gammaproteobacteria bacterium]|nr:DUF4124 domain-containing protein [Gammaproteobacteria bacterium]MDP6617584.1 DUF4124 domain-containing protein [Gammaproteobacteria bacterium]MDP6694461.1 DUF4124 domain-containing protein [Gammaproteobacteria bacterium]MDP7041259.1 DUF4124 domain-containing protein [Gammaproteobacteria bacterium]
MKSVTTLTLVAGLSVMLALQAFATEEKALVYSWVDEDGVTHFGDRVPPEYARGAHNVLNRRGVQIDRVEGEKSSEQKAEEARLAAIQDEKRMAEEATRLRDRVLLSTYLSVDEIEALRDRRVELLAGQIRVTQLYLNNLRAKLAKLERQAQRFSPYNKDPSARPIDKRLARELSDTLDSIMLYERSLTTSKNEQLQLVAKFDSDIDRFRELHRLN